MKNNIQKIRVLIVDDEELARSRIISLLSQINTYEIEYKEAKNAQEALGLINSFRPHMVFLDIEMPFINGINMLYNIEKDKRNFQIIFQTAYPEFALKAFEENACDYLLKPYSFERFSESFERAIKKIKLNYNSINENFLTEKKFIEQNNFLEFILVKIGNISHYVQVDEVSYFKSEEHRTSVFWDSKSQIIAFSLNHLEEVLDPKKFIRLHRNSIVRISNISKIISTKEGPIIELKNLTQLQIAKNRKKEILNYLLKYKDISV